MTQLKFDFKITTWERVIVPIEIQNEIFERVKSGEITSANDIFSIAEEMMPEVYQLFDTEHQMTIEENNGEATIEVYDDKKSIWDNKSNGKIKYLCVKATEMPEAIFIADRKEPAELWCMVKVKDLSNMKYNIERFRKFAEENDCETLIGLHVDFYQKDPDDDDTIIQELEGKFNNAGDFTIIELNEDYVIPTAGQIIGAAGSMIIGSYFLSFKNFDHLTNKPYNSKEISLNSIKFLL